MRRLAALSTMIAGIAGVGLFHAAQARAAGGCSVASAPTIASGTTQSANENDCPGPDHYEYWALNLRIGDTLTVNATGTGLIGTGVDVYGPDVGTIGGTPECGDGLFGPVQVACLIPAAGRYVLAFHNATVSFTPTVKSVPPPAGRAAGACDAANAPTVPARVTEYSNANLCAGSGSYQYWAIDASRGDTLTVDVRTTEGGIGTALEVYGPNVRTINGKPLCSASEFGGADQATCRIRAKGRYLIVSEKATAVSFTPNVVHPTEIDIAAPRFVKGGGAIPIRVSIRSNTASPLGTCIVQERLGSRWASVATVRPKSGICNASVPANRRGTVTLRVRFKGAKDWASSTSKPIAVVVT